MLRRALPAGMLLATLAAAPPNPVQWSLLGAMKPVKAGARLAVRLVARIDNGWHLYSMKAAADGPIPTRVWLPEGQPFELAGEIKTTPPETVFDSNFNMDLEYFEGSAEFLLPVRVKAGTAAGAVKMSASASYQVCSDKLCLPPRTVNVEMAVEVKR